MTYPKTVGWAKNQYRDPYKRHMGLQEIESRVREANGHQVAFLNSNYFNTLCLMHCLLDRVMRSLSIVYDGGILPLLQELREPFENTAKRIRRRGGNIRILVLAPLCIKQTDRIKHKLCTFDKAVEVRIQTPQPSISLRYAVIADSRDYRVEESHGRIADKSPANAFSSKVVFNGRKGLWLQNQFDVLFELNDSKYILKEHK